MKLPCFTKVFVKQKCHSPANSQLLRATSSASSSMWTSLRLTSLPARCQNRPTNPRLEPVNSCGLNGNGVPRNHPKSHFIHHVPRIKSSFLSAMLGSIRGIHQFQTQPCGFEQSNMWVSYYAFLRFHPPEIFFLAAYAKQNLPNYPLVN